MSTKSTAVTLRLPPEVKLRLVRTAKKEKRSLSSQVLRVLETLQEPSADQPMRSKRAFLGMYPSTRGLRDKDVRAVRRLLWGRLQGK